MKKVKFWQPLLVLATVVTLSIPCVMSKRCGQGGKCHKKGECPYEAKSTSSEDKK